MTDLHIRAMHSDEVALAIAWAAREGWNPGLGDAACFATVDPSGFLIGTLNDEPAAIVSCVRYDTRFAFLGFYITRPDLRGRGHGIRMWRAAMEHAGPRTIGLDGVVDQQENYAKSGFTRAYANIRFGGRPEAPPARAGAASPLESVPLAALVASDRMVFPASRDPFLRRWTNTPGHEGCAVLREGALAGWGVIRPAREGWKIGPLVADDRRAAETVLAGLLTGIADGPVFLDVPEVNAEGLALARDIGLAPVFETARMYRGEVPTLRLDQLYGVASFELG